MHVTWWTPSSFTGRSIPEVRAAVIREGRIELEERPDPVPGEGELLVRVQAAGLNGASAAPILRKGTTRARAI